MVESGLTLYLTAALAGSPPSLVVPGGFMGILPKDIVGPNASAMAWSYRDITSTPEYVLAGQTGWVEWHVQIDCHGTTAANAIALTRAIDNALRGKTNFTLPDSDSTFVFQIERLPGFAGGFSDVNRTFVRSPEYLIRYQQI